MKQEILSIEREGVTTKFWMEVEVSSASVGALALLERWMVERQEVKDKPRDKRNPSAYREWVDMQLADIDEGYARKAAALLSMQFNV